jgi:predicted  nucleic acid-binding Zn-ribbon protein
VSQETVIKGLQHELERAQDNAKRLEEHVVELKEQIHQANNEKQNLYKQLELVTLRLPAPRVSFWSRVFGKRKKEQEAKA